MGLLQPFTELGFLDVAVTGGTPVEGRVPDGDNLS